MRYRSVNGDRLDQICHRVYGDVAMVPRVLAVNRGLVEHGPVLPAGVVINLPARDAEKPRARPSVRLW